MEKYILNLNNQKTGEHELHTENCNHIPKPENRIVIGSFENCKKALQEAEKRFPNKTIDGCKFCCPECHKK